MDYDLDYDEYEDYDDPYWEDAPFTRLESIRWWLARIRRAPSIWWDQNVKRCQNCGKLNRDCDCDCEIPF